MLHVNVAPVTRVRHIHFKMPLGHDSSMSLQPLVNTSSRSLTFPLRTWYHARLLESIQVEYHLEYISLYLCLELL